MCFRVCDTLGQQNKKKVLLASRRYNCVILFLPHISITFCMKQEDIKLFNFRLLALQKLLLSSKVLAIKVRNDVKPFELNVKHLCV